MAETEDASAGQFGKRFEVVRDGFASPHRLKGLPGALSGCIYRSDGTKVALSERFGGYLGDYARTDNPERIEPPRSAEVLGGRGLYLGHLMAGHYGHFITEGLSTFWILQDQPAENFDYFLFHPFTFGEALPEYARFCFRRFGIDEDHMVLVRTEPVRCRELVVPERLFRLNHSADPRLRWVYREISRDLPDAVGSSRLYVSRRKFSRTHLDRVVANEVCVEREFEARGFEVIFPEEMSFPDQVARYSRAEVLAGMSGSGLHNSIFMRDGAQVIELGDPRYGGQPAPTQALCNSVAGVRSAFIPFTGRRFGIKPTLLFNLAYLRGRLDEFGARRTGKRTMRSRPARVWRDARAALEVGYFCVRPSAGRLVRMAIDLVRPATSV